MDRLPIKGNRVPDYRVIGGTNVGVDVVDLTLIDARKQWRGEQDQAGNRQHKLQIPAGDAPRSKTNYAHLQISLSGKTWRHHGLFKGAAPRGSCTTLEDDRLERSIALARGKRA